jgi:hypothetical protein
MCGDGAVAVGGNYEGEFRFKLSEEGSFIDIQEKPPIVVLTGLERNYRCLLGSLAVTILAQLLPHSLV